MMDGDTLYLHSHSHLFQQGRALTYSCLFLSILETAGSYLTNRRVRDVTTYPLR